VPSPVTFLDLTDDLIPGGLRLCRRVGWNQTEADWRALMAPPSVFRGARIQDRLVGTAGAVVYGDRLAWVCMVLVAPAERGRGLATSLVDQVLERLPRGALVGLDATANGQPVYEKLGFRAEGALARLEAKGRADLAGPALPVRALTRSDLPRVLERDLQVFGADRTRVLRAILAQSPEYALGVEDGAGLVAYGFGRVGHEADQIGPVVAESPEAAVAIVGACLCARPGRRFFLDAYPQAPWRKALEGLGFREQRGFARMYRGGRSSVPAREAQCFAILGPEFG
jgi:GNAT superfamily N-acetyltransferase